MEKYAFKTNFRVAKIVYFSLCSLPLRDIEMEHILRIFQNMYIVKYQIRYTCYSKAYTDTRHR